MTDNSLRETIEYVIYTVSTAFSPSLFKFIFSALFIVISFMFDIDQKEALFALFVLVLLDFTTGISAAKYLGEPIRSSKIKHTAIKLTSYFVIIAGAHLAEHGLAKYLAVVDETVTAFFLLTELISLLENMGRLGIQIPKKLLNQLVDTKNKL